MYNVVICDTALHVQLHILQQREEHPSQQTKATHRTLRTLCHHSFSVHVALKGLVERNHFWCTSACIAQCANFLLIPTKNRQMTHPPILHNRAGCLYHLAPLILIPQSLCHQYPLIPLTAMSQVAILCLRLMVVCKALTIRTVAQKAMLRSIFLPKGLLLSSTQP